VCCSPVPSSAATRSVLCSASLQVSGFSVSEILTSFHLDEGVMDYMFFPVHDASVNLSGDVSGLSDYVKSLFGKWRFILSQ